MKHMAGRKRHSAEDIVRKLRRADELATEGKTGEEIAAELGVSAATLYNWRRTYGGMDTDAAKELKELREQNARLKRLLAEAELEKDEVVSTTVYITEMVPGAVVARARLRLVQNVQGQRRVRYFPWSFLKEGGRSRPNCVVIWVVVRASLSWLVASN